MTDTMTDVTNPRKTAPGSVADQLIAQARAEGVSLVGPGSPLAALTMVHCAEPVDVQLRRSEAKHRDPSESVALGKQGGGS